MNLSQVLIMPVLSEKSVHQELAGKYTFTVHADATKVDVKNALAALYGVHAIHVNILHTVPKYRIGRARKPMQKRPATRRAVVTLKQGEKLEATKTKSIKKSAAKKAAA